MTALRIQNLTYRYPDGKVALKSINLEVPKNSKTMLIGKNGSGKTTLLLHINGLLDGEGDIEILGLRRSGKTIREIRKKVGILFGQTEYHFIMTDLLSDVMLSLQEGGHDTEMRKELAMSWLARFGLSRYADSSPLDLSTGEMKRAALAGVLARDPDIIILDEPLNGLDSENSRGLIGLLRGIPATMIIATHSLFLVENLATHIAVMEDGVITGFYSKQSGLKRKNVRDILF